MLAFEAQSHQIRSKIEFGHGRISIPTAYPPELRNARPDCPRRGLESWSPRVLCFARLGYSLLGRIAQIVVLPRESGRSVTGLSYAPSKARHSSRTGIRRRRTRGRSHTPCTKPTYTARRRSADRTEPLAEADDERRRWRSNNNNGGIIVRGPAPRLCSCSSAASSSSSCYWCRLPWASACYLLRGRRDWGPQAGAQQQQQQQQQQQHHQVRACYR